MASLQLRIWMQASRVLILFPCSQMLQHSDQLQYSHYGIGESCAVLIDVAESLSLCDFNRSLNFTACLRDGDRLAVAPCALTLEVL